MKAITIQCSKAAMLSGAAIPLLPINVIEFGGISEALVYQQIVFLTKTIFHDHEEILAARISYTRLQKQIPSVSRRWIIEVVANLEQLGAIKVIRTNRVNLFQINSDYKYKTNKNVSNTATLLVFPELIRKVCPIEAVALQQIHLRCRSFDGSVWMIRTCNQLHDEIFHFISLSTVKRMIASLVKKQLVYVKPYSDDDRVVNSYRVNYLKLAELLGIPVPDVAPPTKKELYGKWVNPVFPLGLK